MRASTFYQQAARPLVGLWDGVLRVTAPISKAGVNAYYGREICGWRALGLDPEKAYRMLRSPKALQKAAPSFCTMPILSRHADPLFADPHSLLTVGMTGDTEFREPYLWAGIAIWHPDSLALIASGERCGLSLSYRYTAEMRAGSFAGRRYDGVMHDLRARHVAVVEESRAGADVRIPQSAIDDFLSARSIGTAGQAKAGRACGVAARPAIDNEMRI